MAAGWYLRQTPVVSAKLWRRGCLIVWEEGLFSTLSGVKDLRSGRSARIRIGCVSAQLGRNAIRCCSCVKAYVYGNTNRRIPVVSRAKIHRSQGCACVSVMCAEIVRKSPDPKKRMRRFFVVSWPRIEFVRLPVSLETTDRACG